MLATGKQDKDCVVRPFNKKTKLPFHIGNIYNEALYIVCMWEKKSDLILEYIRNKSIEKHTF